MIVGAFNICAPATFFYPSKQDGGVAARKCIVNPPPPRYVTLLSNSSAGVIGEADRYLKMADEADSLAAKTTDKQASDSWRRIAQSYRDLAALKVNLHGELRKSRP